MCVYKMDHEDNISPLTKFDRICERGLKPRTTNISHLNRFVQWAHSYFQQSTAAPPFSIVSTSEKFNAGNIRGI